MRALVIASGNAGKILEFQERVIPGIISARLTHTQLAFPK